MTVVTSGLEASSVPANQSSAPLGSLSSHFGNFLNLLMTQLRNQDPTSPMDANQFTSELVQFSSVEQQISTNASLSKLIELTQTADMTQSASIVGKAVTVRSDRLSLQNGNATINFVAPASERVSIAISDANGAILRHLTLNAVQGANSWSWNGAADGGRMLEDGAYSVVVSGGPPGVPASSLPLTVSGIATGVTAQNDTINLRIGALSVPFSAVASVGN